jgi:protein SCO1/2
MDAPVSGASAPAHEVAAHIDAIRTTPALRDELVDLLAEQSPIYDGRGSNEAERLRGYVLASFEATGLPPAAMPYVLEELQTGRNPYTVAAAARALRGAANFPDQVVPFLLQAIERLKSVDDAVCFDSFPVSARPAPATALAELFRAIAWLGPRAKAAQVALIAMLEGDRAAEFSPAVRHEIGEALAAVSRPAGTASCCGSPEQSAPSEHASTGPAFARPESIDSLELQDQSGAVLTFGEFFHERPSVVAFFYTRCMNPEKCSLTITKLARLQKRLADEKLRDSINVAALSYDPAYDLPARLRNYGADRGMTFDARSRLLRTTGAFAPVQRHFDLGVGYGAVTVNRHRLELLVLDRTGRPCSSFTRLLWSEDDVLDALAAAVAGRPSPQALKAAGQA